MRSSSRLKRAPWYDRIGGQVWGGAPGGGGPVGMGVGEWWWVCGGVGGGFSGWGDGGGEGGRLGVVPPQHGGGVGLGGRLASLGHGVEYGEPQPPALHLNV